MKTCSGYYIIHKQKIKCEKRWSCKRFKIKKSIVKNDRLDYDMCYDKQFNVV